jgi:RNA polymerase sigma factor (sigma-70 family)
MTETTTDWSPEVYSFIREKAEAVARTVRRSYPVADTDDLVQEALMWAVAHPGKLREYVEDDDEQRGTRMLMGAFKNAAREYAVRQRALSRGDESLIDDAWYSLDVLKGTGKLAGKRGLLHHVFDTESWTNPEKPESTGGRNKKDPANGNDWLATLADVSSALDKLKRQNPAAFDLVEAHYHWGLTYDQIGAGLTPAVAKATVSSRMDRAIKKVQEILGGPRPKKDPEEDGWENGLVGTRRSISNAHARALTGSDYDE